MWCKSGQAVSGQYLYTYLHQCPVQFKGRLKMLRILLPYQSIIHNLPVQSSACIVLYCIALPYHACKTRFRRLNNGLSDTPACSWLSISDVFMNCAFVWFPKPKGGSSSHKVHLCLGIPSKILCTRTLLEFWCYYCIGITCTVWSLLATAMILGWLNITWYYKDTSR